jgi:Zn-dependent M28 family amino/carboxypeptidase
MEGVTGSIPVAPTNNITMRTSACLMTLSLCVATAQAVQPSRFDDADIRSAIETLSSDAFGGRAPASAGETLTTAYIAAQFKRYGLLPANQGSYLQDVPLVQITADANAVLTVSGGNALLKLAYGSDVVVSTPRPQATVSLTDSPLVFAGYGIAAPEYQWNDYAGLDVKGKTVVVLVNDPGHASGDPQLFHGKVMTYYGRWTYKYEEAARQGAAGVLIVHDTGPAGYPWEVVRNSWSGSQYELPPGESYRPQIQGWLSHEAAGRLIATGGLSLDELAQAAARHGFRPVDLKLTASITLHDKVQSVISHNVVALVKGSRHPDQAVIYTAHWDHFGTKLGPDGRPQIFHGAADNGTGIAGLLQLARVYARDKRAPARSVLFVATTSEEQGLLGAAYYARHPLVPLADTVADLNMDVMNIYGETRDVTVRGQFMSTLDDTLRQVATRQGLILRPDAEPEKGYYYRADHFEFAKAGVPALSIESGTDYVGRPAGWALAQRQAYISQRYHKPADVYEPGWDLAGMHQQLELLYRTGRKLADGDGWPAWYRDSPFRSAREAQRPAAN